MDKITISTACAQALERMVEETRAIDERARCSDKYFRAHFLDMVKAMFAVGAVDELKRAIEAADTPQPAETLKHEAVEPTRHEAPISRRRLRDS